MERAGSACLREPRPGRSPRRMPDRLSHCLPRDFSRKRRGIEVLRRELKLIKDRIRRLAPAARQHRRKALKFYAEFLTEGDLSFDVGANLGNRTDIFLT